MSDIAIHVSGLSKLYKIGRLQRRHDTLRDRIADTRLFNLFERRNGSASNGYAEGSVAASPHLPVPASDILWTLKHVSFEVKRGDDRFDGIVAFGEVERFIDTPRRCVMLSGDWP